MPQQSSALTVRSRFQQYLPNADHLQNFVYDQTAGLDPEELAGELREAEDYVAIPAYAYDCHTREGRKRGKTKADFFKAEQEALEPSSRGCLMM